MSSLTPCNYCSLNRIKWRISKEIGGLVTAPGNFGLGGTSYHHVLTTDEEPSEDNFVAWFMELTDHCVC